MDRGIGGRAGGCLAGGGEGKPRRLGVRETARMGRRPCGGARDSVAVSGRARGLLASVECGEGSWERRDSSSDGKSSISDIVTDGWDKMLKTVKEHR